MTRVLVAAAAAFVLLAAQSTLEAHGVSGKDAVYLQGLTFFIRTTLLPYPPAVRN